MSSIKYAKIRLSIVDSCLLTRISLKHILSTFDIIEKIKDFENADNFIASLKSSHIPDIVLMSMDLNGINGIEATKLIKKNFQKLK